MIDQYPVDLVDNSYPLLTGGGLRIAWREMLPEIFDCHFLVAAIGEVTVRRRTRIPARYLVSRQQPGAQPERGTKAFNVLKAALSQRRSRGDVMHALVLQSAKVTGKQGNEMVVSVIFCLHRLAGIQRRPSDDVGITIRGPSRAAGCFPPGGFINSVRLPGNASIISDLPLRPRLVPAKNTDDAGNLSDEPDCFLPCPFGGRGVVGVRGLDRLQRRTRASGPLVPWRRLLRWRLGPR